MLYSLAYLAPMQPLFLSAASIFLVLLYLWPLNIEEKQQSTLEKTTLTVGLVTTLVFIAVTWLAANVELSLAWLVFSIISLLLSGLRIVDFVKHSNVRALRLVVQWLVVFTFIASVYLWLGQQIHTDWLVISLVGSFVITVVNGSWLLVNLTLAKFASGKAVSQLAVEDVFLYSHDPATNLPSYQHALHRFEKALKANNQAKYAAIVFKPTNFQQVNTVLGHHNSDLLLLQFAYCLQKFVESNDALLNFENKPEAVRIARLQSLHFLVVLDVSQSHHPEKTVIENLCQQISAAVPEAMSFKSFSLHFELAFGIAMSGEHGVDVDELISFAGDALLSAEENGALLRYFDHQRTIYAEQQLSQMEQLKADIRADNLHWHLQPKVHTKERSFKGFELMVNWRIGETKPIQLQQFNQIVEHSGDAYLLTKLMIEKAFDALVILQQHQVFEPVAINLVSKQVLEPDLIEFIEAQIEQRGIAGQYLMIELTESVLLDASAKAKSIIDQLKTLDVKVAIDAFSGSYESLRYIRKMSIDQVKIDCQLLGNPEKTTDKAIINALISLTRSMQLPLVGVGIDTTEVERIFSSIGGELVQGQAVGRGIAIDDFDNWLQHSLNNESQP
ncbi:EAL domain-containing protein [Thalassotalea sp. PLHSN55]|uniref:EAL domain-containing protein n=1 Tax=Thalassotalea sp. PLHSN55 TaxID=3435888 RepID=UPI003F84FD53